jgi:uridine kinase
VTAPARQPFARAMNLVELAHIARERPGAVRLVGVDGCGGAGKTTLAARLARTLNDAAVVHTDDFASHDVPIDWWPRLLADVVEPLLRGEPASYRPYDWVARRFDPETVTVAPQPFVVIEGVGATRAAWRDRLALRLWVDTPRAVRLARGIERDSEQLREFWQSWMAAEDSYVADERPWAHADVVVDGDPTLPHDPETDVVVLRGLSGQR